MNTQLINTINDQIDSLSIVLYADERANGYNNAAHYALQIMAWELDHLHNGSQWQVNVYD